MFSPVEVGTKINAFLTNCSARAEAEHLIATTVGENRTGPRHESMQPATPGDQLIARSKEQVVRVGEHDFSAGYPEVAVRNPSRPRSCRPAQMPVSARDRVPSAFLRTAHDHRSRSRGTRTPLSLEVACYTLQADLPLKRLRLGVIYGGRSSEHEVSLASAAAIFANLDSARYEAIPIHIDRHGRWSLEEHPPTTLSAADVITQPTSVPDTGRMSREAHFVAAPTSQNIVTIERNSGGGSQAIVTGLSLDVVFPVIHGPYGEDGTLQGLLELANVPYVGAGVLASAAAMDKAVAKVLFSERGLPQVDYAVVTGAVWDRDHGGTLDRLVAELPFPSVRQAGQSRFECRRVKSR